MAMVLNEHSLSSLDRARGALLGLAVGDALGAPVEFKPRDSFERVTEMMAGGYFRLPAGAWTDDTAMGAELAIFYLAEIEAEGPVTVHSRCEAGEKRLRPILMPTLIAILTLSPVALGLSRGSGLQQPLATAIIFGLIAAVPLLLLFLPATILVVSRRTRQVHDVRWTI